MKIQDIYEFKAVLKNNIRALKAWESKIETSRKILAGDKFQYKSALIKLELLETNLKQICDAHELKMRRK